MINLLSVVKHYLSNSLRVEALKGIDLEIGAGEFTAIAGPSGSGKSTLLNLIGCLDSVTSGSIELDGVPISTLERSKLADIRRHNIGFIFQSFNLIPVLSAYENIAFSLSLLGLPEREIRERVEAALAEVALADLGKRRPNQLSGGQQQRVAVARALVKNPQVVLADEPTANLDSKTGESILELMGELNTRHGTTFIFSTHDKMVMDRARRVVRLHDGLIVADEWKEKER